MEKTHSFLLLHFQILFMITIVLFLPLVAWTPLARSSFSSCASVLIITTKASLFQLFVLLLFLSLSALTAEQFLLFKLVEKCAKWYNRHFTLYTPTRTRDQTLHDIFKIEAISELYIYPLHIHFSFSLFPMISHKCK